MSLNENKIKVINDYLIELSKKICADNACTENNHNCNSYAYFNANYDILDVCLPDYFQGSSSPTACIPFPWTETMEKLKEEIDEQIEEQIEEQKNV